MPPAPLELDSLLTHSPPEFGNALADAHAICDLLQKECLTLAREGDTARAAELAMRCAERFRGNVWVANTAADIIQWHLSTRDDPPLLARAHELAVAGISAFEAHLKHIIPKLDNPLPFVLATFLPKSGGTFIVAAMKQRFGYRDDIVYGFGTANNNLLLLPRVKVLSQVGGVIGHMHVTPTAENIGVVAASGQPLWAHLRDPRDSFCSLMTMMHRERERPATSAQLYSAAQDITGLPIDHLLSLDAPAMARALWCQFGEYCSAVSTWTTLDLPRTLVTWHSDLAGSEERFFRCVGEHFGLPEVACDTGFPEKNYAACRFHQGVNGRWRDVFDDELKTRMTETMEQMGILAVCEGGLPHRTAAISSTPSSKVTRALPVASADSLPITAHAAGDTGVNPDLVFDIGLHTGKDAEFYLLKGFRVIAVEANSVMAERTRRSLHDHVANGSLTIVEKALYEEDGKLVTFYVNDEKDDWSSLERGVAEKGVTSSREVFVETISLEQLLSRYGVPHYLKCDIEGGDLSVAAQLARQPVVPTFVSFEITSISLLAALWSAGYRRFQLVNQAFNHLTKPPRPATEGLYVERRFDGHSSGLFGKELPDDRWVDIDSVAALYSDFMRLRERYSQLCMGWLDIHAGR